MREMNNKEVIIVAGPSASGKSHLLKQLLTKKKNKFRDKIYRSLKINPNQSRSCVAIGALTKQKIKPEHSRKLKKDLIFIHFDTTSRRQNKKKRLLLSITKDCESVKVLTIHTTFETWRTRMQKRIESSPNEIPLNRATEIYNLSRYIRFFARIKYHLAYKRWAEFINDIDFDDQLIIKNEEIPFKSKRQKFPTK